MTNELTIAQEIKIASDDMVQAQDHVREALKHLSGIEDPGAERAYVLDMLSTASARLDDATAAMRHARKQNQQLWSDYIMTRGQLNNLRIVAEDALACDLVSNPNALRTATNDAVEALFECQNTGIKDL